MQLLLEWSRPIQLKDGTRENLIYVVDLNKLPMVAGVYVLEVAETRVSTVHRMAEERGYPLRSGIEKE